MVVYTLKKSNLRLLNTECLVINNTTRSDPQLNHSCRPYQPGVLVMWSARAESDSEPVNGTDDENSGGKT